jgi:pilus assembly protein CpaB
MKKMHRRTLMIIGLALVFGVSAAMGVYLLTLNPNQSAEAETVDLLVVSVDVSKGQTLLESHLAKQKWPKNAIPEGALADLEHAVDRTTAVTLTKGELLLDSKLAQKGAGRGLAAVIPQGMRAVTIQTPNVATGVAGFILPGNKVDVLLGMSGQGNDDPTGGGSTVTLLQNVEILAVDQRIEAPQDNKMDPKELRSVTLLVTPTQAAELALGQNKGTLHLSLRNHMDSSMDTVDPATMTGLKSALPAPRPVVQTPPAQPIVKPVSAPRPPRRRPPTMVRTLKGAASNYVTFPAPEPDDDPEAAPVPDPALDKSPAITTNDQGI